MWQSAQQSKQGKLTKQGELTKQDELQLSPTVRGVRGRLVTRGPVSASAVASAILSNHDDYGKTVGTDRIMPELAELDAQHSENRRPVEEWLDDVRTLFEPDRVAVLHGRHVIIGLSLLDEDLRSQLQQNGFLDALESEVGGPIDDLLTHRGRKIRKPDDLLSSESVPIHADDALSEKDKDHLDRYAFARFLAKRIRAIAKGQQGAYSIHLYGPWGAGKTSVLNFLCTELEKDLELEKDAKPKKVTEPEKDAKPKKVTKSENGKWLVVEFNAWRHQHIRPPWWSLMDRVYQVSRKELGPRHKFQEFWWRSRGTLRIVVAVVILLWLGIFAYSMFPMNTLPMPQAMKEWGALADSAVKLLAVFGSLWALAKAFSGSLLQGSARAAQSYQELTSDPMNNIVTRFNDLIKRLPKRVAIFVDDLDRCQSGYVIELLEGIQTLFRDAPVIFVVVADRRWLNACFEDVYKPLTPWVHEPGRPLGTLFLEKAFQFSTAIPGIAESLKEEYWRTLLQPTPGQASSSIAEEQQKARERMATKGSAEEVMEEVAQSHDLTAEEMRAMREEAALRVADPELVKGLESTLAEFGPMLEPNPRAMKRLVNIYCANLALALLSGAKIGIHPLARWTIISMRWPRLAEYLEENPEMVELIGEQNTDRIPEASHPLFHDDVEEVAPQIPEEFRTLFDDDDVEEVIRGGPMGGPIKADIVSQCARLHA